MAISSYEYNYNLARKALLRAKAEREMAELMDLNHVDYSPVTRSVILSRRWHIDEELAQAWGEEKLMKYWNKLRDIYISTEFEVVGMGGFLG